MSEQNINLVKEGYTCFQNGDLPGLLNLFTDDIEWTTPNVESAFFGGTINGRDTVGEFFTKLAQTEDYSVFEPTEFIATDDKVVVLGKSTATVLETGRSFSTDWIHVFTIRDSKVSSFLEFFDTAEVNKAFQKVATA